MALLNATRTRYVTTDVSVTCKDHLNFQNMCSWRAVLLLLCVLHLARVMKQRAV